MEKNEWESELKDLKKDFDKIEATIDSLSIYKSIVRDMDLLGLTLVRDNIDLAKHTLEVMLHSIRLHETMEECKQQEKNK